jgi:adenosine deaminase
MIERSVECSISTDDPAVFKTNLNNELCIACDKIGVGIENIARSVGHGIEAAFVEEEGRSWMRTELDNWCKSNKINNILASI